jgi:hypothetical protein
MLDESRILLARGYQDQEIACGFGRALATGRGVLLRDHVPSGWCDDMTEYQEGVNCVSTYSNDVKMGRAMARVRSKQGAIKNLFPNSVVGRLQLRSTFRKGANLRSLLLRNKPRKEQRNTRSLNRIGPFSGVTSQGYVTDACAVCKRIRERSSLKEFQHLPVEFGPLAGQQVPDCNCLTTNITYGLTCLECHQQGVSKLYIGETSRSFRKRMQEHKSAATDVTKAIEKIPTCPRLHCVLAHQGRDTFIPMVLGVFQDEKKRKAAELELINKLQPEINKEWMKVPLQSSAGLPTLGPPACQPRDGSVQFPFGQKRSWKQQVRDK